MLKILLFYYISVSVCECECRYPPVPEEGLRSHGVKVIGNCKDPDMCAVMEIRFSPKVTYFKN